MFVIRRVEPHRPHIVCGNRCNVPKQVVAVGVGIWAGHYIPLHPVPMLGERACHPYTTYALKIKADGPNVISGDSGHALEHVSLGDGEGGSGYDAPLVAIPVL